MEADAMKQSEVALGDVVHFVGKRRRYVVVSEDEWGKLALAALSGGKAGCGPRCIKAEDLERDLDQAQRVTGREVLWMRRKYQEARGLALQFGHSVADCKALA